MAVKIVCPKCKTTYNVAEGALGKMVKCQNCQSTFAAKALVGSTAANAKAIGSPTPQNVVKAGAAKPTGLKKTTATASARTDQELARFGVDGPIAASPSLFATDRPAVAGPDPLANHVVQGLNFVPVDPKKLAAAQAAEIANANPFENLKKKPAATLKPAAGDDAMAKVAANENHLIAKWYTHLLRSMLMSTIGMVIGIGGILLFPFVVFLILGMPNDNNSSSAIAFGGAMFLTTVFTMLALFYSILGLIGAWRLTEIMRPEKSNTYLTLSLLIPLAYFFVCISLMMEARTRLQSAGGRLGWTGAKSN